MCFLSQCCLCEKYLLGIVRTLTQRNSDRMAGERLAFYSWRLVIFRTIDTETNLMLKNSKFMIPILVLWQPALFKTRAFERPVHTKLIKILSYRNYSGQ